ncbi:MAG: class I SAM-dependent methyltransferase [Halobacteriovoraceae bacterium]|nr:class I SAM-dependent methyltransferase [Halobacteriovoraceae bacterium]
MSAEIAEKKLSRIVQSIYEKYETNYGRSEEKLNWLKQLTEFPMGRDLLLSGGINSFWIDYLVKRKKVLAIRQSYKNYTQSVLERQSYVIDSWRRNYQKFINLQQSQLKDNAVFASIPCGLMRDFFNLDFSKSYGVKLVGIDIDKKLLKKVNKLSKYYGVQNNTTTYCCDALNLPFLEKFDLISSCGLNIYLSNLKQLTQLYKNFFCSLKQNGVLLIHFLTIPPFLCAESEWKINTMNPKVKLFDNFLLENVLKFSYTSTSSMIKLLRDTGFNDIQIDLDLHGISAIGIAKKNTNTK